MKKFAPITLSAVLALTSFNINVSAEQEIPVNDFVTQLTEQEMLYDPDSGGSFVYPEQADSSVLSDTVDIYYSDDDHEKSFEDRYIEYSQIITGNDFYLDMLNTYYENTYAENAIDAYDILSGYFSEEEINIISELNNDQEENSIYKLLRCFLDSDEVTEEEKNAVKELILSPIPIVNALNAFMRYSENKDNVSDTADTMQQYLFSTDDAELYSTYSSGYDESLYTSQIIKPKYYNYQGNNIYVDQESGNLRYERCDVSVPVSNGYMTLPLVYDVSEAIIAYYTNEGSSPGGVSAGNISKLGAGWKFKLTRIEQNILYLADGRNIELSNHSISNPYFYNDITLSYNKTNGYTITYLDGSKEYINASGYLYKTSDKYGNITEYTYGTGCHQWEPTSVTSQGKTITIEYNDDATVITKPYGDVVRYTKEKMDYTFGALEGRTWTGTPCNVLRSIMLDNGDGELSCATFYYDKQEYRTYQGAMSGGLSGFNYQVFAAMNEAQNTEGYCDHYSYTSTKNSFPEGAQRWNIAVKNKIRDHVKSGTAYSETYSDKTYSYGLGRYGSLEYKKITEVFKNGKTIETVVTDNGKTVTNNIKDNNVLVTKETKKYRSEYEKILLSDETSVYNSAGNYITTKYEYEYNDKNQVTCSDHYIEGELRTQTLYTYENNFLKEQEIIRGGTSIDKVTYTLNEYGDPSDELHSYGNESYSIHYTRDIKNRLLTKEYKKNNIVSYTEKCDYAYDNMCLPDGVYNTDENENIIQWMSYQYDLDNGQVLTATDGSGNTTTYTYDSRGNIICISYPDSTSMHMIYNDDYKPGYSPVYASQPIRVYSTGSWYGYQYELDYYGNVTKVWGGNYEDSINDFEVLQTAEYDIYGNLISETDANGNTVTLEYDILGRQTSVTYPIIKGKTAQPVKAYYYDVFFDGSEKCSAKLVINQENKAQISYYDLYGRNYKNAFIKNMSSLTDTDWNNIVQLPSDTQLVITQTNEFDDHDRIIKTLDGEDRPVSYTYDMMNNITSKTVGSAADGDIPLTVNYTYDAAGNVLTADQDGHITTNVYDRSGRLIKTTDPMGYSETYTYDLNGNITKSKDKNNVYTYNTYDSMYRLTKTKKGSSTIDYTYDLMGRMIKSKDSSGTISYEYDWMGNLISKTYPDGKSITYDSYDANRNLLSMTDCWGNVTTYTYNERNALSSVSERYTGESTDKTETYNYNNDGSIYEIKNPNNVTTLFAYDYAGRVTSKLTLSGYKGAHSRHSYAYDNAGNIIKETRRVDDTSSVMTYEYDSLNRLHKESYGNQTNVYSYDSHSNMIIALGMENTYYSYDDNNRLTRREEQGKARKTPSTAAYADWYTSYSYDANGTLLSSDMTSDQGHIGDHRDYTYNSWGQLTGYSDAFGNEAEYTYYSDGLRKSKTVAEDTITYYYNGGNVINESKNGSLYATNVMGADGYISRKVSDEYETYFMKNLHGDVTYAFTSEKTCSSKYDYNAWGEFKSEYNSSVTNPICYSGEYYDEESGMIYLRGRYYSSEIRRFISEDPAKDGLNWYAYCGNNPVMYVDPLGLYEKGDIKLSPEHVAQIFLYTIQYYAGLEIGDTQISENAASSAQSVRDADPKTSSHFGLKAVYGLTEKPQGHSIIVGFLLELDRIYNNKTLNRDTVFSDSLSNLTDEYTGSLIENVILNMQEDNSPSAEFCDFWNRLNAFIYNAEENRAYVDIDVVVTGSEGYINLKYTDYYNNIYIEEKHFQNTYGIIIIDSLPL